MSHSNNQRRSWEEVVEELVEEKDYRRFQELAEELHITVVRDLDRTNSLAQSESHLSLTANLSTVYEKIVDAAVVLMRSDYASLQMLFPQRGSGGELQLLAFRGFDPDAARFWEWVSADSKSTCGMALRTTQRVVAPDIAVCHFMADSEDQEVYLKTGIHSCQTTPLIGPRAGNVVGMISTHWREAHQPADEDLRQFDILAEHAAEVVERCACVLK